MLVEQMRAHVSESNALTKVKRVKESIERVEEEKPEEPEATQSEKPEEDDNKVTETKSLTVRVHLIFYA